MMETKSARGKQQIQKRGKQQNQQRKDGEQQNQRRGKQLQVGLRGSLNNIEEIVTAWAEQPRHGQCGVPNAQKKWQPEQPLHGQ